MYFDEGSSKDSVITWQAAGAAGAAGAAVWIWDLKPAIASVERREC